jgi:hypothetical protein
VQDFDAAASRHLDDAVLLEGHGRLPNADHLAGFAAECALKALLVSYLGAQPTKGKPFSMSGAKRTDHGHLPPLWEEVKVVLTGRAGGRAFAALLIQNPFATWSVNDRYNDGRKVTSQLVAKRLSASRQILGALQNAKVLGFLP